MKVSMALGVSKASGRGISNRDLIIPAMTLTRFSLTLSYVITIFHMVAMISPIQAMGESFKVDSLRVWAILVTSSLSNFNSS